LDGLLEHSYIEHLGDDELNKNAYDIAFKQYRDQFYTDALFRTAIMNLMKVEDHITEDDYIRTVSEVCKMASMYKEELYKCCSEKSNEYYIMNKYEY